MNNEKNYDRLTKKADQMVRKSKFDNALAAAEEAISLFPKRPEAHSLLGQCYCKQGNYEQALECFKPALAADAKNAETYFYIGKCYLRLGNKQEAFNNFYNSTNLISRDCNVFPAFITELINNDGHTWAEEFLLDTILKHPAKNKVNLWFAALLIEYKEEIGETVSKGVLNYIDMTDSREINLSSINKLRGEYFYQAREWYKAAKYLSRSLEAEYNEDTALKLVNSNKNVGQYDDMRSVLSIMKEKESGASKQLLNKQPVVLA